MLSPSQEKKFNTRAKEEVVNICKNLKIDILNEDTIGMLQEELDSKITGLVTASESLKMPIDQELLQIYDLLTDIILDNEDDFAFLNQLFCL